MPDCLLGQEYSSEKLLDDLAANPHRLFVYDEAETFFKMLAQTYNPTLKSALMTLWRDDWYVRKTKTKDAVIKNAYLCWGGASTPVQIAGQINGHDTDLLSGMLPRFTLVPYFGEEHSIPNPPPSDTQKKASLVARLMELATTGEREYSYSPNALKMIEDWQRRFDKRAKDYDPILGAFLRKMRDEHFHKLAMLSAFERGVVIMDETDLAFVVPHLWQIESQLSQALGHLTDTQFGRQQERVSTYLRQRLIVTKSDLYRRFSKIGAKTMEAMLYNLQQQDLIDLVPVKGKTKPTTEVRWIENIHSGNGLSS